MENILSIVLPDFGKEKKTAKPKKPPTVVTVEKSILSKINRTVTCKYCENQRILNPDQYQSLFEEHGSEEVLNEEFMCKPCYMNMKRNPIKFWTIFGESYQTLSKNLKYVFEAFKSSPQNNADVVTLQAESARVLKECGIIDNYEFVIHDKLPVAITIKSAPFVGIISLRVYEQKKNRIYIHG